MNELALHDHSGGSGSGTRALGGSATGLTVVYIRDGAAPGTPTGTISAVFTTGSRLAMLSSGGTVVLFATSGHEHTSSSVQSLVVHNLAGVNQGLNISYDHNAATATVSTSLAVGGSGKRTVSIVGGASIAYQTGSLRLVVNRAGTAIGTFNSGALTDSGTSVSRSFIVSALDIGVASGTYTYDVQFTGSGYNFIIGKFINVREISVP